MATEGEPPTKKRKLNVDDFRVYAPLDEQPERHSVLDLYDPEMVTVTVIDRHKRPNSGKRDFKVPKALLCRRSEYFDKLFSSGQGIGEPDSAVLKDSSPLTFGVFLGWLYCHSIFSEEIASTSVQLPVRKGKGRQPEPTCRATGESSKKAGQSEGRKTGEKGFNNASGTQSEDDDDTRSIDGSRFGIWPLNANLVSDAPKPVSSLAREQNTKAKKFQTEKDTSNPNNPVTWPWCALIDLYLFADQYSTRTFRMQIFLVIQSKLTTRDPRPYSLPSYEEICFAARNLSPDSPLYRLLVDMCGTMLRPGTSEPRQLEQIDAWAQMPSRFLAASLMAGKRNLHALSCDKCPKGDAGDTGVVDVVHEDEVNHSQEDLIPVRRKLSCFYHEHGGDKEEARRCHEQWESRRYMLGRSWAEPMDEEVVETR